MPPPYNKYHLKYCWFKNKQSDNEIKGIAYGQLKSGFVQSMSGKLKSPSIIMLGKGEGMDRISA